MQVIDSIYVSNEKEPQSENNQGNAKQRNTKDPKQKLKKFAGKNYMKLQTKFKEYKTEYISRNPNHRRNKRRRRKSARRRRKPAQQNPKKNQKTKENKKLVKLKQKSGAILFFIIAVFAFLGSTVAFSKCEDGKRNIQMPNLNIL